MTHVLSFDLGTGGIKASLFAENGISKAKSFVAYETKYENDTIHEQRPLDWVNGIIKSTKCLLGNNNISADSIEGIAISGHSLGVIPISHQGEILVEKTPIWSDRRARLQAKEYFKKIDFNKWYRTTGNGFPAELYSIFKMMWYRDNIPELFNGTAKWLGTKDCLNYLLTGNICTDYSYASGSGAYNLLKNDFDRELLKAADLNRSLFPEIRSSTALVGTLKPEMATLLGLKKDVKVFCGGVDNSCMALGASSYCNGKVYTSIGSSAWISVSQDKPLIDDKVKPFVFSHVVPGQYTSAVSIFSAGSSYQWVRDNICKDLLAIADNKQTEVYELMEREAEQSPIGAHGLLFNPSLAGGSAFEPSSDIRGGFAGLTLAHKRGDLIRASLEGIAINLSLVLAMFRNITNLSSEMILVGGGSKSPLWRRIFADTFGCKILKSIIDQDAASLGAAGIALVGLGIWEGFAEIEKANIIESMTCPIEENVEKYKIITALFMRHIQQCAEMGNLIAESINNQNNCRG